MNIPIVFNIIIFIIFIIYYFTNKNKAVEAAKLGAKSFKKIFPLIVVMLLIIIIMQKIFSYGFIIDSLTRFSGWQGYLIAVFFGSIVHIPHFVVFPLAGQLLQGGVYPGFIAVLVTSLVMVHTFSIPLEIKELGFKFAVVRNLVSLVFAIVVGVVLGVLY